MHTYAQFLGLRSLPPDDAHNVFLCGPLARVWLGDAYNSCRKRLTPDMRQRAASQIDMALQALHYWPVHFTSPRVDLGWRKDASAADWERFVNAVYSRYVLLRLKKHTNDTLLRANYLLHWRVNVCCPWALLSVGPAAANYIAYMHQG